MITNGELGYRICKESAAKIVRDHGFRPRHVGKLLNREEEPGWIATLYDQHVLAIDSKCVLDSAGNAIYVFNVIDHGRRILHHSVAAYHPSSLWVEQHIRNVLMTMDGMPDTIRMDRDSFYTSIGKRTLQGKAIKPLWAAYKCPSQNVVVERSRRTLNDKMSHCAKPSDNHYLN